MNTKYRELGSDFEIKQELDEIGIDVFEPETRSEEMIAQALDEFSSFVLHEGKDRCLEILENDLCNGDSVGELQGGNDVFSIYRVSFPVDEYEYDCYGSRKCNNAALQLLKEFNDRNQQNKRNNQHALTTQKLKQYMLGMCDRRSKQRQSRKYASLGNLMFILQFGGPTQGQVRHIDNMVPNVQICLYMSACCPSTIVYAMDDGDGAPVTNGRLLLEFWERSNHTVPELVKDVLQKKNGVNLKSKWYTKFFAFWSTIDSHLNCFGKLYQPVSFQLGLQTYPGTTLMAGGNEVHAGPPTTGPRMFAFAIGIPEEDVGGDDRYGDEENFDDEDNNGEVQYSPVMLHIDFCCLMFSILDYEYSTSENEESVREAKHFLLCILLVLIRDYPTRVYLRQVDDDRSEVRNWLENVLDSLDDENIISTLLEEAVNSDTIFYTPDIKKRRSKKKKRRKAK